MNKKNHYNEHFRQFAKSLEDIIWGYDTPEDHYTRQKRQVETLVDLERKFRKALINDRRGPKVYEAFVRFVRDERRNILAARPYFRERQDVFKSQIAPALRERKNKALYRFDINYSFIHFAIKAGGFKERDGVMKLARKVEKARQELVEMNIPIAISRARVFARHRQQHLEYMDLVQVATEGLIASIDKFVLPYQKSFGAVMYGRITGDLIEANSETLVHFYPSDKRKIYTANKLVKDGKTFDEIARYINAEAKKKDDLDLTDQHEIQQLHIAAYTISGDSPGKETEASDESPIHRFEAEETWRPDVRLENIQLQDALRKELSNLSLFERKLLRLKGIPL